MDEKDIKITVTAHHEELREGLYQHLVDVFDKFGLEHCSGRLKLTRKYLKKAGLSKEEYFEMLLLLQNFGGYCDCEVVMNAYESFPVGETLTVYGEVLG